MRVLPLFALLLTACAGAERDKAPDADRDGTPDDEDCAPDDPAVYPGAAEACNDVDDDCDGEVDNDPVDGTTFYGDADGDGFYGDADTVSACALPDGYAATADDCDDTDPAVHPGVDETCNDIDDDCDGAVDNGPVDGTTFYGDADGDGFYGDIDLVSACSIPDGYSEAIDDCDDTRADAYPGAAETCNELDDDCDGAVDNDPIDGTTYYGDADGDGFYGDTDTVSECAPPEGYGEAADDCDDTDADTYPGAPEGDVGLWDDPACDGGGGSLARADFAFIGDTGDLAGTIVSDAGDVDGDGLDDLLVGAFASDLRGSWGGAAYLILGSTLAGSASTDLDLADADFVLIAEAPGDWAGTSVSTAGDVDGDGLADILVGSPSADDDSGRSTGKAYLFLGSTLAASPTATLDLGEADYELVGPDFGEKAGDCVSSAGDVDGDGLDDLFIGARYNGDGGTYAGKAYLVFGSTLAASTSPSFVLDQADFEFIGENRDDLAGTSVRSAGDVDGDGLDDLLVGAPFHSDGALSVGKSYLILGSTLATARRSTLDLSDADFELIGESSADYSGRSVSGAGDVDGDGLDDIIVGAYYDQVGDSAGKSYLILGSTLAAASSRSFDLGSADVKFTGEAIQDRAGYSVRGAGDVDSDGLADILVGAPGAGTAYLILGRTLAASSASVMDLGSADFAFTGESAIDTAALSISPAGDVDGDGRDDLFVGAPYNRDGGTDAGKAYLILSGL